MASGHYIPKDVTQQTEFLLKHPTYDGRNTVIAILDTGVDPSCPGLQKTTNGKQKIIDCMDLTGAGDVDTSTIKKADENGILIGLTERELKIPKIWKNPSRQWHLGTKILYELYTSEVKQNVDEEHNIELKKKTKLLIAAVMKEKSNPLLSKEDQENINAMLEYLKVAEFQTYESPVADCIVWNDGNQWKACIDLSFTGDLENAKIMSSYHKNYEYGFISDNCLVSYCFNIHENGNLLEICVPNGSHGTHVAHIAAGHFSDEPEKDGLAPGAQIVSLCVGDLRKGSYLSEQALLRALEKCRQLKVDVINFSYGASSNCVDSGNIAKLITIIVKQYGIIFVASAGNDGPSLSTMGFANGKIHHSAIYVGAYLTAEMKKYIYGHSESSNSTIFPFSSCGPCLDGTWGVSICAPGAAITGVSKQNLTGSDLMHGTSMSSPNAAGNILCMLSGMKAESIPISPFRVKLALMNTAKMPEPGNPFTFGAGIVQIDSAFEYVAVDSIPTTIDDIRIDINGKRGIYLRDPREINKKQEMDVNIITDFFGDNNSRINFEHSIALMQSKGPIGSIKHSLACRLPSSLWRIEIDPTKFESGKVNVAEIIGISKNATLGPLFRIPITVILPREVSETNFCLKRKLTLKPPFHRRIFIKSPVGCNCFSLIVGSLEKDTEFECDVQCVYIACKQILKQKKNVIVSSDSTPEMYFSIQANTTMELSFTKKWCSNKAYKIGYMVKFYGFSVDHGIISSINPTNKIRFTNTLTITEIYPIVEFTEFCYPLIPLTPVIEAMNERDVVFGSPSFRLLLTYNFVVVQPAYYKFEHEGLEDYKAYIDCFLLQIFTATNKYIATCSGVESIWLEKGDYIIRIQYRHTDDNVLTYLQQTSMLVSTSVPKIVPRLFTNAGSALTLQGEPFPCKKYQPEEYGEFYMEQIRLPALYPFGSYFKGNIFLQSTLASKPFTRFAITYPISNTSYAQGGGTNIANNGTLLPMDVRCQQSLHLLTEVVDIAVCDYDAPLLSAFCENFAQCQYDLRNLLMLPYAFCNLANLVLDRHLRNVRGIPEIFQNGFNPRAEDVEIIQHSFYPNTSARNDYATIISTAKQILSNIKTFYGYNSSGNSDIDAKNVNPVLPCRYPQDPKSDDINQKSSHYVLNMPSTPEEFMDYEVLPDITQKNPFETIEKLFQAYMLIADQTSENTITIQAKYAVANGRFGIALMGLKKIMVDKTTTSDYISTEKAIIQLLKKLGWNHLAEEAQKAFLIKHQKNFRPF